jgi:hypothetical protein
MTDELSIRVGFAAPMWEAHYDDQAKSVTVTGDGVRSGADNLVRLRIGDMLTYREVQALILGLRILHFLEHGSCMDGNPLEPYGIRSATLKNA